MRVLDIGCGANLIYPLLGAAMHGWAFVGADVTDAAIEWAERNRAANPHLAPLLEVRRSAAKEGASGVPPERCAGPLSLHLSNQHRSCCCPQQACMLACMSVVNC